MIVEGEWLDSWDFLHQKNLSSHSSIRLDSGKTEYSRLLQQALFVPSIPVKIMLEDLLLIYHYES